MAKWTRDCESFKSWVGQGQKERVRVFLVLEGDVVLAWGKGCVWSGVVFVYEVRERAVCGVLLSCCEEASLEHERRTWGCILTWERKCGSVCLDKISLIQWDRSFFLWQCLVAWMEGLASFSASVHECVLICCCWVLMMRD